MIYVLLYRRMHLAVLNRNYSFHYNIVTLMVQNILSMHNNKVGDSIIAINLLATLFNTILRYSTNTYVWLPWGLLFKMRVIICRL